MSPLKRYAPLVAVVVAAFLAGNLVYNVENLDWGDEQDPPEGYSQPVEGQSVSNSNSIANSLRYVFAGTIILLMCGAIVMSAGKAAKDPKGFLKSMGAYLLAGGLIIGLFGIMAMSANPHGSVGSVIPFIGSQTSQGTGSTGDEPGAPTPLASILVVVALAFFVLMAVAAFIFLGKARRPISLGGDKDDKKREVAAALGRARDELAVGGDYRIAVLRCYRDMVKLLSGKGVKDRDSMTAREFEALASAELELGDELGELTALFEEARYSQHDVAETQRERAARAFDMVRTTLLKTGDGHMDAVASVNALGVIGNGK
ncbi:MAG: DUF4129 domain-containing protein [Methanobacteriota archaeon]